MKCPRCESKIRKVKVAIEGTRLKAISMQCINCDYFVFDQKSMEKAIADIKSRENPIVIKQKIIKLSKDRLGTYFNKNIISSLGLKPGENVYISVPDKKHIIISRE